MPIDTKRALLKSRIRQLSIVIKKRKYELTEAQRALLRLDNNKHS